MIFGQARKPLQKPTRPARIRSRRTSTNRSELMLYWEKPGLRGPYDIEFISEFDARGMQPVYCRSEYFGRYSLHMNVWRTCDERLVARLWSRCREAEGCSIEVVGFTRPRTPSNSINSCGEHWIPECLREEYESWIISEVPFVFSGPAWCAYLKASPNTTSTCMARRSIENSEDIIGARSARIASLMSKL